MPNKKSKAQRRKQPAKQKQKKLQRKAPRGASRVQVKPPQKPKYNVLGTAVGGLAKALDNKYTGGIGQKIFTALTGSGDYVEEVKGHDYDIESNTIVHPSMVPEIPRITDDGGLVRTRHREFIADIVINTLGESFTTVTLNPGNSKAFPWLSGLGNRFQQYKFLGAVVEYVTLCGNAVSATVPALGQVNMVTTYDVSRAIPTNTVERLNTFFSNSGVISADLMMAVECETTEQPCQVYNVYNQQETKSLPDDRRWYDFAEVSLQILGAPKAPVGTNYIAGQLWITYDLLLIKPVYIEQQIFPPQSLPNFSASTPPSDSDLSEDMKSEPPDRAESGYVSLSSCAHA